LPWSITLAASLDRLAERPYRLEADAYNSTLEKIASPSREELPFAKQQSKCSDIGKLARPLENLDELASVLAEFFLCKIEKATPKLHI